MMKKLLLIFLLFSIFGMRAQQEESELNIKKSINTFFEGIHTGDTVLINKAIGKDLILQTTFTNKEGKHILRTQTKEEFLEAVSKKETSTVWFEKLLSYSIKIDQNLASVWTPYEFYLNNVISHCGVNSFQLFYNNGKWDIIYIIDTRKKNGCRSSD